MDLFETQKPELSKREKLLKSRKVTTDLTKKIIDHLNNSGCFKAWRNNNIPSTRHEVVTEIIHAFDKDGKTIEIKTEHVKVHFKKNQKTVSTLDIIGFRLADGMHLEIEIKTSSDTLDTDQQKHLSDLQRAKCISFATGKFETYLLQIEPYKKYKLAF